MSNPIVEVKHLSHRYSVDWAIRDINFSIEKTGILGLLGSNGAGKSTTMNIICGVLNQTEGDVFIPGTGGKLYGYPYPVLCHKPDQAGVYRYHMGAL